MTWVDPTGGPQGGANAEKVREAFESIEQSAAVIHVGAEPPTIGAKQTANRPAWKQWFDTTNKLQKIWSPTHNLWITLTPIMAQNLDDGTTTSTTFGDLTGSAVGPAVTIDTGTEVLVDIAALWSNDGNALAQTYASFTISGATSSTATDQRGTQSGIGANNEVYSFGKRTRVTGLTAGVNTFTMKYRVTGGTAFISNRNICVTAVPT